LQIESKKYGELSVEGKDRAVEKEGVDGAKHIVEEAATDVLDSGGKGREQRQEGESREDGDDNGSGEERSKEQGPEVGDSELGERGSDIAAEVKTDEIVEEEEETCNPMVSDVEELEENEDAFRGDRIGGTTYSQRHVLKLLIKWVQVRISCGGVCIECFCKTAKKMVY